MTFCLTPGALVGRYEIIRRIGAGGMAEVYLARPRGGPVDERVAIKRLLPTFAHEPRFIDMFIEESRLAATLHHPNIAAVFDVGVDHDACYYAMEYVDGHDVRALLAAGKSRDRTMPLAIAIAVGYGTTCALAYLQDPRGPHASLNLVHRDISPSNILVSFDGAIKLVDFGIARIEKNTVTRTASGQLKGKVPYMSPEQCRARPLDGRSDLFSLGVTLYELTTNTRPFDQSSEFDTLEAIVRGQFAAPSRIVPGYPADLEDVVTRLLAVRPADRYPSAGALLVDLDRIVAAHGLDLSGTAIANDIAALLRGDFVPSVRVSASVVVPVEDASSRTRTVYQRHVTAPSHTEPPPVAPLSLAARAPIDRVAARETALLTGVAPGTSDARDLPASAVAKLIGRAAAAHACRDHDTAVLALELALSAARAEDGVDDMLATSESLIAAVFTSYIGDQSRLVAVSQHLEQLVGVEIDQRAAFLLTRIDANMSARELIATCGLPKREAYRHLCQLMLREIVVLI